MSSRTGNITVNTTDILPIIKKWLYSEHDIFLRELVSNASDAILKRQVIGRTQNITIPTPKVTVELDRDTKTIRIIDNGIGMTEEEVEKYIAKLAFSGAEEFVQKMKQMGADQKEDIIGKFGLGFYSVFMVAEKVVVDSLSMHEGSKPCRWISEGNIEYTFEDGDRSEVGTTITIHVNSESLEFLDKFHSENVLKKYCSFMPYPIFLNDLVAEREKVKAKAEADKKKAEEAAKKAEEKKDDSKEEEIEDDIEDMEILNQINDPRPIWKKDPTQLKDEDYLAFYKEHFPYDQEPLFWIHLKIDHPFELLGVLYFPKLNPNKPVNEQSIRLYAKQVFVSDNVKNIIPEFLGLLKGYIDSPDIPLNVSRSSLQGDPNIKKISNYVVKKVADSLKKLVSSDRDRYNRIWEDIGLFVKYGCISDEKFDETMRQFVLLKNSMNKLVTLGEYRDSIPENYKEKMKGKILYSEKGKAVDLLRRQLEAEGLQYVETDNLIDPHFMQQVEYKKENNPEKGELKFASITSEMEHLLEAENTSDVHLKIRDLFKDQLFSILKNKLEAKVDEDTAGAGAAETEKENEKEVKNENFEVEVKAFKNSETPAYIKVDEQMKRFQQMTKTMGRGGAMGMDFPVKKTLVVNPNNPLVQSTFRISEQGEKHKDLVNLMCLHIADLATLSSNEGPVSENSKDDFIARSQKLMTELSGFVK